MKRLYAFVEKHFDIIETILAVAIMVSLFLVTQLVPYSLQISFGILIAAAVLYWIMAVRPFEKKVSIFRNFTRRVVWSSYMMWALSLLMKLGFEQDVDTDTLFIITMAVLGVGLICILLKRFKLGEKDHFMPMLAKTLIFILILAWLMSL